MISSRQLYGCAKALFCLAIGGTSYEHDYGSDLAIAMQEQGRSMPAPVLFADSNWMRDYFGFTVNPGSGLFELWRFDSTGTCGFPMGDWRSWLDGTRRHPTWGVYPHPREYAISPVGTHFLRNFMVG